MKGVHCSWVDMQKIRQALASGRRGDQAHLEHMRCVDKRTVSTWKAACDVLDAVENKVQISGLSEFQPSHAYELARAFRKQSKEWDDDIKDQIAEWVDRCEKEALTVEQLRTALAPQRNGATPINPDARIVNDLQKLIDAGEIFGTVYADPPWQYGNQATRAATSNHYGTMTVDEIAAMPVGKVTDQNAHLHLWTTNAFLFESKRVIEAWGFEYKSCLIWVKPSIGLGNYWRVSHEFLLLGVRGDCPFPDGERKHMSWIHAKRGKHSSKPNKVRGLIEKVSPGNRLELFGRGAVDGWTVLGDQIERGMHDHDVREL